MTTKQQTDAGFAIAHDSDLEYLLDYAVRLTVSSTTFVRICLIIAHTTSNQNTSGERYDNISAVLFSLNPGSVVDGDGSK